MIRQKFRHLLLPVIIARINQKEKKRKEKKRKKEKN